MLPQLRMSAEMLCWTSAVSHFLTQSLKKPQPQILICTHSLSVQLLQSPELLHNGIFSCFVPLPRSSLLPPWLRLMHEECKCPTGASRLPRPQKPNSLPIPNFQTRQETKITGRHLFEALSFETKLKIYESIRYDSGGYLRLAGLDAELLCWEGTTSTEDTRALTHSIKQLSKNSWCSWSKMK